jgi:hypothetical protein
MGRSEMMNVHMRSESDALPAHSNRFVMPAALSELGRESMGVKRAPLFTYP